jgi:NTE family protein
MNRGSVLDDEDLEHAIEFLIPDMAIEELPRRLVVVTTDLETGDEVRITGGPLRTALKASSAIPGMVPAVKIGGRQLVDGAVVAEVPVGAARDLGWPVVAVDVSMDIPPAREDNLVLDTMMRAQTMTSRLLRLQQLREATHIIRPMVGDARWAEWQRYDEFIELGRRAMRDFLGLGAAVSEPLDTPRRPAPQPDGAMHEGEIAARSSADDGSEPRGEAGGRAASGAEP